MHYYYVNHEIITDLIEKKLFVEYAKVHGNVYGTSLQAVKKVQDEGIILTYLLTHSSIQPNIDYFTHRENMRVRCRY